MTAIDLPGRAEYGKPGWRMKLDDYADAVVKEVRKIAAPTILVGHSMGGQVISAAAERIPDQIERLVYVAAFLPRSGDSIVSLGREDTDSWLPNSTTTSVLRGTFTIKPTALAQVFCDDCTPEAIAQAQRELVPESIRPSFGKVSLSSRRFGSVPRSYIRCTDDRAISLKMQDLMISRQGCEHVATLKSSHSPFISMPEQLVEAILQVS